MKIIAWIILIVVVIGLSISVYFLHKEAQIAYERARFYETRSDRLQKELIILSRFYNEKERTISEFKQSVLELENSINLESLERHIPKKIWAEIKLIIDRIRLFKYDYGEDSPAESVE